MRVAPWRIITAYSSTDEHADSSSPGSKPPAARGECSEPTQHAEGSTFHHEIGTIPRRFGTKLATAVDKRFRDATHIQPADVMARCNQRAKRYVPGARSDSRLSAGES